jgi:hypothetical protein
MESIVCVIAGVLFISHALQKIIGKGDYLVWEAFYFPFCILIITKLLFSVFIFITKLSLFIHKNLDDTAQVFFILVSGLKLNRIVVSIFLLGS